MSNIGDEIKLKIITICHLIFIIFVLLTPLSNSNYLLFMHSIIIPFILLHWLTNNDICALTLMEKTIRKKINKNSTYEDCFTCRIIDPVFKFDKNPDVQNKILYSGIILLWIVSVLKLYKKYKTDEIRNIYDLFIL